MDGNKENIPLKKYPLEDLALKTAAQYFGEEFLPYLGIHGSIKYIAPTEDVHLEVRQMYQDFNYALQDGVWLHLEFESDSIKIEDLRRFREYEATTSRIYGVEVSTCVICTSSVKKLLTELRNGINTYKIGIIRLKDRDADQVFENLLQKKQRGEIVEKKDLVQVILSPLMSGSSSEKERILRVCQILRDAEAEDNISKEEIEKFRAVIYAFAVKFLKREELEDVKEAFRMTILGEMIWEEGREEGREEGVGRGKLSLICKKLQKGQQIDRIAEALEEDVSYIESVCRIADKYAPEYDEEKIYREFIKDRCR